MTLRERLDRCASGGSLSTADLATWFDIAYPTIRTYREGLAEPYPARRAQIEQRLTWLERAVATDPRLPVPLHVRAADRRLYIKDILAAHLKT